MGDLPILTLHEVKTKILCQFPNKIKPRFKLAKERDLPQREGTGTLKLQLLLFLSLPSLLPTMAGKGMILISVLILWNMLLD